MTEYKKKLIEVALPLEAINRESAREKSIRHGHPSTLHLWWARRPLAACRAVLFASLVDDPSECTETLLQDADKRKEAVSELARRREARTKRKEAIESGAIGETVDAEPTLEECISDLERERLFRIIEELVKWENSTNKTVLETARAEIMRSVDGNPPPVLDPFCGGGSIPLEAQRLGLEAHASDLNPVAVLITKALIEIPPKFAGLPPVNPRSRTQRGAYDWTGAEGLAEDVRYYGRWMRDLAEQRVGHLFPKVTVPVEYGGGNATVIAWLWARTVRCPNPACGAEMPLVRSFVLSSKKGKQAWVEPIVETSSKSVRFVVRTGVGVAPEGTVNRQGARCIVCGSSVPFSHVRTEGQRRGLGERLMAVVVEAKRGRAYVSPEESQAVVAQSAEPKWRPDADLPHNPRDFKTPNYGMSTFADLFTERQLMALTTLGDLVGEARQRAFEDAETAWSRLGVAPSANETPATYADAVATYLGLVASRLADYNSAICSWHSGRETIRNTFARQAIPMVWDFAEVNPFSDSTGNVAGALEWVAKVVAQLPASSPAKVRQLDATASIDGLKAQLISTDPPYYDNIGYADLSDFFYVWLRHALHSVHPDLFSTLMTPKAPELVATPYRFGGDRKKAQAFFEHGLGAAFERMRADGDPNYPLTVYYAFKQAESEGEGESTQIASTGWETMLAGLLKAGFSVTGTWPMRSEMSNRPMASGTNALASSVVLVCRPRRTQAPLASRREFLAALKVELPDALRHLKRGNIAPVDLAQASIGPGMAVFSRFPKVLEADGSAMSVHTALALINHALDAAVAEQEGEFDSDTRWAIAWFQEVGMEAGDFGRAELLSKAKNTAVQGMVEARIVEARAGKVRLLRRDELDENWDPATDRRLTVWEMTQHLIRRLDDGEAAAAALSRQLGSNAEVARDLAYRLYLVCERKKWSQEGQSFNGLVVAWPEIVRLAAQEPAGEAQGGLF